jgi:nickel-dependent lactate racemase
MKTEILPKMVSVRQRFPASPPLDISRTVNQELSPLASSVKPGARVAVAVGSRGITNLQAIVTAVVETLRRAGGEPFIVPAMGSHGGATPEGQTELLAEYGITEKNLQVPIRAAMEVGHLGKTKEGYDVYFSAEALKSDGIVIVNRVKPHTDFAGGLGSGILKMIVVGLGKQIGAANFHINSSRHGYERMIRAISQFSLSSAPILGGVAIVENQRHDTARISFLKPQNLEQREEELFQEAKRLMPKLPIEDIDRLR